MRTVAISGIAVACIVVVDFARRYLKIPNPSYPLPPGPKGLPFIGNVIGADRDAPWLTYADWAKKYGDLVYIRLWGRDIIIINSETIAKDLLEKRSWNYSDRPYLATRNLCGREFSTIFLEYGDRWRLHRRFFHQTFRSEMVHRFVPLQHRKVYRLLRRLLNSPEQFSDHISEYTSSVILNSVYDYEPKSQKDDLIGIITKTLEVTGRALRPNVSVLVEAFPALLYLPSWFPGMSFKRDMAVVKASLKQYVEQPFEYSLQRLVTGSSAPSMISDALRNVEDKAASANTNLMKDLSEAAATAFIAGSETSNSVILTFLLMMLMAPEVQKKAQMQIDAVVGQNRLPTIEDRHLLPYVEAILRETLRYNPIVPLSIPHAAVKEDVYGGYRIPEGAMIISNLWSMGHNESKFPNPHAFIPERFLEADGTLNSNEIEHIAYGFGRRICVGRYFADTSMWSVMVNILAAFTIENARDEKGVKIPVDPKFSGTVTAHPLPFPCKITPRVPGMNAERLEPLIEASTVPFCM